MNKILSVLVLLSVLLTSLAVAQTPVPALVDVKTVMSGVTTNTTTQPVAVTGGIKSFVGKVVCTSGACTQTQAIKGSLYVDGSFPILLCTLTLSATPSAVDACPPVTAVFNYVLVTTTNTTGTAATGEIHVQTPRGQ